MFLGHLIQEFQKTTLQERETSWEIIISFFFSATIREKWMHTMNNYIQINDQWIWSVDQTALHMYHKHTHAERLIHWDRIWINHVPVSIIICKCKPATRIRWAYTERLHHFWWCVVFFTKDRWDDSLLLLLLLHI